MFYSIKKLPYVIKKKEKEWNLLEDEITSKYNNE